MVDRVGGRRVAATGGVLAVSVVGRWASVALEGEFDLSNADEIPAIVWELAARGTSELTVDLGPVTFLDVSAINALRAANRCLVERGGRLLLVGLSPLATRVLRVTGLDRSLPAWTPEVVGGGPEPPRGETAANEEGRNDAAMMLAAPRGGDAALTAVFRRLAEAAASTVPGCTAASCGVVALGTARTAAPSDPLAVEIDIAQYELGRGPCLRAIQTARRAALGDGEERARLARPGEVEDVCSVPLTLAGLVVGSLNCYGADRRFSEGAAPYVEALGAAGSDALGRVLAARSVASAQPGRP